MKRKETLLGQMNTDRQTTDSAAVSADIPRWQKVLFLSGALAGVLFVAYSLLGFFFAPWLLHRQLIAQVDRQTGLAAELRRVHFNPYTLTVKLSGLRLQDGEGAPLLSCEELVVNLQAATLFREGLVLRKLEAVEPALYLVRNASGGLNLIDPLTRGAGNPEIGDGEPDSSIPLIVVQTLAVQGGKVFFRDSLLDEGFESSVEPIDFSLESFSTHPEEEGTFTLSASGAQGFRFRFEGELQPNPVRLSGKLQLEDLSVHHYHPYFGPLVNFELETATLGTTLELLYEARPGNPTLQIRNGAFELREAYLRSELEKDRFFSVPRLSIGGIDMDFSEGALNIDTVEVVGGNVLMIQEKEKGINLIQLLQLRKDFAAPAEPPTPGSPDPAASWDYRIGRFEVTDFKVFAEDQSAFSPARYELLAESFVLTEISNDKEASSGITGAFAIGEGGRIELEGSGRHQPVGVELSVMGSSVPISLIEPYLDRALAVDIEGGLVAYQGEVEVSQEADGWVVRVGGDGSIDQFETLHEEFPEGRLRMNQLRLSDFEFLSKAPRFSAAEIAMVGLKATYFRFRDGRWLSPFRETRDPSPKQPADSDTAEPASSGAGVEISVDRVALEEGELNFIDRSVNPSFRGTLGGVQGKLENISNQEDREARFELQGDLNELGNWKLAGGGDLLNYEEDLEFNFDLDPSSLTLVNSYSEKYLGRRIDRGKLSLDLDYQLKAYELAGDNQIVIDQIVLGESVPTEDKVVEFPLGLAVAALEDPQGVMDLKVNISGRLDDPSFRLGGVLSKAILNLLSKAATAPFTMLASLANTNEELSYVQFAPGEVQLSEESRQRLDALGQALLQRPNLKLEYSGATDPNLDRRAVKEAQLGKILEGLQERDASAPQGDFTRSDALYRNLLAYAIEVMEDRVTVYPDWDASGPVAETRPPDTPEEEAAAPETEVPPASTSEASKEVELELEIAQVRRTGGGLPGLFGLGGRDAGASPQTVRVSGKQPSRTDGASVLETEPEPDDVSMEFPEELPPLEILEEQILSRMELPESALQVLVERRERVVRSYLVETVGIPEEQLYLVNSAGDAEEARLARVNFSLGSR